jgi:LysM repeat protein
LTRLWRAIARSFQNPTIQILATALACLALLGLVWVYKYQPPQTRGAFAHPTATALLPSGSARPQAELGADLPTFQAGAPRSAGVQRQASLHTELPDRPPFIVTQYTVEKGDTIFDIAEKFGLKPSTILWGNLNRLGDNPSMIYPGQVLNILPTDGVYYEWHEGDGLNGVARALGVTPEMIIDYPGNYLNPDTLGSWSHPNIAVGTWIIVPGGFRNFITWSAPTISRFNPGVARLYGPGACDKPSDGAVGTGTFVFPTVNHWLSGFDYAPEANHAAVDFGGALGNAIYAADNGVIVYAGWNDHGYGEVTVIDHGNGYQTLYAHQSQIRVVCGQSVYQGDLIGNLGSTGRSSGPHLHFEISYNGAKISPYDFLDIERR